MRVLITGANGFIGRYLVSAVLHSGHSVVPAVRAPGNLSTFQEKSAAIAVDFNRDTKPEDWLPRLAGVDAVINCAGILQGGWRQNMDAIHHEAPIALFRACEMAGVARVIQISAISAVTEAGTSYALSKKRADDFLKTTGSKWTIVKPSLVYAPGVYGGTALLRGLAALPFVTPIVGDGSQSFRPLTMNDLCSLIIEMLENGTDEKVTMAVVGPEDVPLAQIITDLRDWLGLPPARKLHVPKVFIRSVARLGDLFGGSINSTAYAQLEFGNAGTVLPPDETLRTTPTSWRDGLRESPSQIQDRWHARLYFLRPLLRIGLGLTWILSGLIGFLQPYSQVAAILNPLNLGSTATFAAFIGGCTLDIAIGLALLLRCRPALMACIQVVLVLGYTVTLSVAAPTLWSDPFGALLKNLVFVIAALSLAAIERDR